MFLCFICIKLITTILLQLDEMLREGEKEDMMLCDTMVCGNYNHNSNKHSMSKQSNLPSHHLSRPFQSLILVSSIQFYKNCNCCG